MPKKYEFSPTRVLTVTGTAHKWYMCDIFEEGSDDEICHVSHKNQREFEGIRDAIMMALETRQEVKAKIDAQIHGDLGTEESWVDRVNTYMEIDSSDCNDVLTTGLND